MDLKKRIEMARAGARYGIISQIERDKARNLDQCLASYAKLKGKKYLNDDAFEDLVWVLKKKLLIKESGIEDLRLRLKREQKSDDDAESALMKLAEFSYIEQFEKKLGVNADSTELIKLQTLLAIKGLEFSIEKIKDLIEKVRRRKNRRLLEEYVFSTQPQSIAAAIRQFLFHLPNPSPDLIRDLASLLKEGGFEEISEFSDGEGLRRYLETEMFKIQADIEIETFERILISEEDYISINSLDRLSGLEFEQFLSNLFERMGYTVEQTRITGDQGADLVAVKFGERTVVQAKRFGGSVGNKAVQEVVAAKALYKADKAIVVTNNFFTTPAQELAKANAVELIDREALSRLLSSY
ncbi:MAG TPA: restriction endonuclease [Pyrinomonadaceae bacterium]|nr:restriction endonuclease [Pyrinomonadaceae bacterium]